LWESNSCTRYLAAKHGGDPLSPADLQIRGNAERWMDWQMTTMSPALVPVFWGLVRTPPEKRDMDAIEAARKKLSGLIGFMDAQLSKTTYLAGDDFTIGDIPLGITAYRWFVMDMEREDYPDLKRWYDSLTTRKAFQDAVMNPLS
jgi:glutathione S-transferase